MENQEETKTQVFEGNALEAFFKGETPQVEEVKDTETLDTFFKGIEDDKEEVQEAVKETQKATTPKEVSIYASKLKDYIEEGFFVDADVEVEGDNGETIKVPLSELEEVTPEMFQAIKVEQKRIKDEELSEKYISSEGIDERTRKMIELKKAGGDLTSLIQEDVKYTHALKGVDLDNEQIQESLVRQKLQNQGLKPKFIELEIAELKENMTLDVEAKKIKDEYDAWFDEHIETEKASQLEKIKEEREQSKMFKKSLSDNYKALKLPENITKVLLENSTKTDEYGLTNTDKLYFDAKSDPESYAELNFFLNNREEFKKFLGVKVKNDTKVETVRRIISLSPKALKSNVEVKNEKADAMQEFFKQ